MAPKPPLCRSDYYADTGHVQYRNDRVCRCGLLRGHPGDHDEMIDGESGVVTWPRVEETEVPTKSEEAMTQRPQVITEPCMRFGEPHIGGISVDAIAGMVWAGESISVVAEEYGRTRTEVLVACWWMARHGTKKWRQRWAPWLRAVEDEMWHSGYEALPDPPSIEDQKEKP